MPPRVVDVWADNEEAELARLSGLFKDFPVAVVATYRDLPARRLSHPGHLAVRDGVYHVAGLPPASSSNLEYKFDCLLARTKGVRFLQLVLALLTRDGAVALGRVWRFHLAAPRSGDEELFLAGLGLESPARRRADRARLACGAAQDTAVTWVTCDGAEDVCSLLDCFLDRPLAWRSSGCPGATSPSSTTSGSSRSGGRRPGTTRRFNPSDEFLSSVSVPVPFDRARKCM